MNLLKYLTIIRNYYNKLKYIDINKRHALLSTKSLSTVRSSVII